MKRYQWLPTFSLLQLFLFVPVARYARKHPHPMREWMFTTRMQRKRSHFVQQVLRGLTNLMGLPPLFNLLVLPVALWLWRRQWRMEAIFTIAISWLNLLLRTLIANLISRPRPFLVVMSDHNKTKSFPSGHVCSAVAFWGWLASLSLLQGTSRWQKAIVGLAGLCMIGVGPSRVYLGDHWATDVLGGYLLSGGWLGLSLYLYLWCKHSVSLETSSHRLAGYRQPPTQFSSFR